MLHHLEGTVFLCDEQNNGCESTYFFSAFSKSASLQLMILFSPFSVFGIRCSGMPFFKSLSLKRSESGDFSTVASNMSITHPCTSHDTQFLWCQWLLAGLGRVTRKMLSCKKRRKRTKTAASQKCTTKGQIPQEALRPRI